MRAKRILKRAANILLIIYLLVAVYPFFSETIESETIELETGRVYAAQESGPGHLLVVQAKKIFRH